MRTAPRRALAAAIAGLCLGGGAAGQELTGPSLGDRFAVNALEYPWSAIGRVNAAGRSYCTGFMVGERHALTSGHCLFDRSEGRRFAPPELHFVAAYQHDRTPLHSAVRRYALAGDLDIRAEWGPRQVGRDWAILELQEPIGRKTGYLGLMPLDDAALARIGRERLVTIQAGYRAGYANVISIDPHCRLLGFVDGTAAIEHDCEVFPGDSGSPILVFVDGGFRVVAVPSGGIAREGALPEAISLAWATSVFGSSGSPAAAAAARQAGLRWGPGQAPIESDVVSPAPSCTVRLMLEALGYAGAADRAADPAPLAASIRNFQRDSGHAETGEVSERLLGQLLREALQRQAAGATDQRLGLRWRERTELMAGLDAYQCGDYVGAVRRWSALAEKGVPEAQTALGEMYRDGRGLPQDWAKAAEWLRRAAIQGFAPAQYGLGALYDQGRGVPANAATARSWLQKAADQGHPRAQAAIGIFHLRGRGGLAVDAEAAVTWFRRAAERNDAIGAFHLGLMYAEGQGRLRRDESEAARWFEAAADQGYPPAQAELGEAYGRGAGVPQDRARAHLWLALALDKLPPGPARDRAARALAEVEAEMTAAERAQAETLRQSWQPRR